MLFKDDQLFSSDISKNSLFRDSRSDGQLHPRQQVSHGEVRCSLVQIY